MLDLLNKEKVPHPMGMNAPSKLTMAPPGGKAAVALPFGLASPWRMSPGNNPEYPNHHPIFSNIGAPGIVKEAK
jgi:hypothetical protein